MNIRTKEVPKTVKTILCLAISLSCLLLSGCSQMTVPSSEEGYATDTAMSAVEYTLFLTKEIAVPINELTTRAMMAQSVINGSYETSKEISNTDESISKVEEAQNAVETTMPATTYESDRQNTLNLFEDALIALEDYKESLASGNTSTIEGCMAQMKACALALSAESNPEYE